MASFRENNVVADGVLRVLSEVQTAIFHKVAEVILDSSNYQKRFLLPDANPSGFPPLEYLTEIASMLELGKECSPEEGEVLIRTRPDDEEYVVVYIQYMSVHRKSKLELLANKDFRRVGVMIWALQDPSWVYCCPVSYPQDERWFLDIDRHERTE